MKENIVIIHTHIIYQCNINNRTLALHPFPNTIFVASSLKQFCTLSMRFWLIFKVTIIYIKQDNSLLSNITKMSRNTLLMKTIFERNNIIVGITPFVMFYLYCFLDREALTKINVFGMYSGVL